MSSVLIFIIFFVALPIGWLNWFSVRLIRRGRPLSFFLGVSIVGAQVVVLLALVYWGFGVVCLGALITGPSGH
jgi:hypothetical protein